ncbi:MAG: hypothetical protein JO352_10225 [Chloroflexi bacterium]|nr:hypothetical protein [Chloroflexota bacterium]
MEAAIAPSVEAPNLANVRAILASVARAKHPPPSPGSRRGAAIVVKRFDAVLVDDAIVDHNPLVRLKRPRVGKQLRQPFTAEEISAMWRACQQKHQRTRNDALRARDEALLLLLVDTGVAADWRERLAQTSEEDVTAHSAFAVYTRPASREVPRLFGPRGRARSFVPAGLCP